MHRATWCMCAQHRKRVAHRSRACASCAVHAPSRALLCAPCATPFLKCMRSCNMQHLFRMLRTCNASCARRRALPQALRSSLRTPGTLPWRQEWGFVMASSHGKLLHVEEPCYLPRAPRVAMQCRNKGNVHLPHARAPCPHPSRTPLAFAVASGVAFGMALTRSSCIALAALLATCKHWCQNMALGHGARSWHPVMAPDRGSCTWRMLLALPHPATRIHHLALARGTWHGACSWRLRVVTTRNHHLARTRGTQPGARTWHPAWRVLLAFPRTSALAHSVVIT